MHEYDHDPNTASYGLEAAEKLGVEPDRVFKTLVVTIDGAPHVAIVPVESEVDLRSLGKRVAVNAEGDLPTEAVADLFPAYDEDGGLLLVLTPE